MSHVANTPDAHQAHTPQQQANSPATSSTDNPFTVHSGGINSTNTTTSAPSATRDSINIQENISHISGTTTNASTANMTAPTLKEPKTPSLPKYAAFSSPAPVLLPETPERVPRHINELEDTPLLSPPHASFHPTSHTPQRHRNSSNNANSTDFYTLLKSPARSQDDNKLKRRSMELFGITNANKSPEQMHKEYDSDHLLKSPRRDYKEIRKISENLRTRLNYANVKVQHGWSNKSIGELEHSLEEIATNPQRSAQLNSSKNLEDFWNLRTDNLPNKSDINNENMSVNNNNSNGSANSLLASPGFSRHASPNRRRKSFVSNMRLDDVAKRNSKLSPELLPASQFLSHPTAGQGLQGSPIKKFGTTLNTTATTAAIDIANNNNNNSNNISNKDKKKLSVTTKTSDALEQDAIMSLISLSSPVKYSGSLSPSPPRQSSIGGASPTRSNHSRLPSLNGISNKRLPPLPPTIQPPYSAPGVMSSSSDSSILAFDRAKDNRYILPSPPKFDSRPSGLGMMNVGNRSLMNPSPQHDNNEHQYQQHPRHSQSQANDADATDNETTEDEMIDDDDTMMQISDRNVPSMITENNSSTESNSMEGIQQQQQQQQQQYHHGHHGSDGIGNGSNKNGDIFRTTKFDGVKMTSKRGK